MTTYRRNRPDPALADVVEHYWTVRSPAPPEPLRAVLVPNGRAVLQLCLGEPGTRIEADGTRHRNADVLLPAASAPVVLEQRGPSHYVGVQLTPWGPRRLWPAAANEPLPLVGLATDRPDREALVADPAAELDRWLAARLTVPPSGLDVVRQVVAAVDADPAGVAVGDLPRLVGASASTVYRQMVRATGLTPHRYLATMRHRRFTDTLLEEARTPLAAAALAAGYFDQAHAARDFRRLTGIPVTEFRDVYDGIARLMVTGSSKPPSSSRS